MNEFVYLGLNPEKKRTNLPPVLAVSRRKLNMKQIKLNFLVLKMNTVRNMNYHFKIESKKIFFADELMRNLQQIKRIVHAKWSKNNGHDTAALTQEELTAEAEKLLKKSQSKNQNLRCFEGCFLKFHIHVNHSIGSPKCEKF